jgi:hypothetical protein
MFIETDVSSRAPQFPQFPPHGRLVSDYWTPTHFGRNVATPLLTCGNAESE